MDDLQMSWYNFHDHDHDQEQSFDFYSENMFLNPTQQLSPSNWADQAIAAADFICSNPFIEIKDSTSTTNTTTTTTNKAADDGDTSLECLLNSTTEDGSDGIKSLLFNNFVAGDYNNINLIGVSSGDEECNVSQCSSGKRANSGVGVVFDNDPVYKPKRSRSFSGQPASSNINFQNPGNLETDTEVIAQMKEMIYREAAFRPVSFGAEPAVERPKRKNVRISSDPQTVAARQRRERISERIRVLQKLVPGGNKLDTASMLDEAASYLKFLRSQVKALENLGQNSTTVNAGGTSSIIPDHASLVVPFTQNQFSMQPYFQFPHENVYSNPPPC